MAESENSTQFSFTASQHSQSTVADSNKKVRFNAADDVVLLKEIINVNPFEFNSHWADVQVSLCEQTGKNFSIRNVKEHTDRLLKLFKKQDTANLRKSGTEEQYEEKERLLQQVVGLKEEYTLHRQQPTCSKMITLGRTARDAACARNFNSITNSPSILEDRFIFQDIPVHTREVPSNNNTQLSEMSDILSLEIVNTQNDVEESENGNVELSNSPSSASSLSTRKTSSDSNVLQEVSDRRDSSLMRKKQTVKGATLQYLKFKAQAEDERKKKEALLEERRIKLEERRQDFEERNLKMQEDKTRFEIEERHRRLDAELEERSKRLKMEEELQKHKIEQEKQKLEQDKLRLERDNAQQRLMDLFVRELLKRQKNK